MSNPLDSGGNVQVDHVWGNLPMQPDDARGENTLDPDLDNHIIAVTGYNGFPAYIPQTAPYDDTTPNVTVPDLVGGTQGEAESAIEAAGLVVGTVTTSGVGSTAENDETVKSQTPAAGTVVNEGATVSIVLYAYTVAVPDVVGDLQATAEAAIEAAGLIVGAVTTADNAGGATSENDGTVKTQTPAAATAVSLGTEVDLVVYDYTIPTVAVPDVSGDDQATATAAIEAVGLVVGTVTTSADGATVENDGTVKSQSPAAATVVNVGTSVDLVLYAFAG